MTVTVLLLVSMLASVTSPIEPKTLLGGDQFGFAKNFLDRGDRIEFRADDGKLVITLKDKIAEKWRKWFSVLGGAHVKDPTVSITNAKKVPATFWRFQGGVILAYQDKVVFVPRSVVVKWEAQGGWKGRHGFPVNDPMPLPEKSNQT